MTPYRHLLCPVDFSDISRIALEWSLRFAKDVGGRVTALHVMDTAIFAVGNLAAVPGVVPQLRQVAEEQLARWKEEMDLSHVQVELQEGAPDEAIVAASARPGVDLVVMGTHGIAGFQKFLLGSVTERVLHRIRVPLLTLSPKVEEAGGGNFVPPKTIVMGIDFGDEAGGVVRHGVWLAEHYQAKLIAVHAVPVPYVVLNDKTLERLGARELERLQEILTADRRKELSELLPETMSTEAQIVVRVGSPFETLVEQVQEHGANLVVLGAGGHGESGFRWLGSTCHKMVRSAARPVLVVR